MVSPDAYPVHADQCEQLPSERACTTCGVHDLVHQLRTGFIIVELVTQQLAVAVNQAQQVVKVVRNTFGPRAICRRDYPLPEGETENLLGTHEHLVAYRPE